MAITDKKLEDLLEPYPDIVKKNRKKHLILKNSAEACQQIEANTRTIPGIISQRGCAYAGCKGVVVGPIKDMVHIVHGPVGCCVLCLGNAPQQGKGGRDDPEGEHLLPALLHDGHAGERHRVRRREKAGTR